MYSWETEASQNWAIRGVNTRVGQEWGWGEGLRGTKGSPLLACTLPFAPPSIQSQSPAVSQWNRLQGQLCRGLRGRPGRVDIPSILDFLPESGARARGEAVQYGRKGNFFRGNKGCGRVFRYQGSRAQASGGGEPRGMGAAGEGNQLEKST